MKANAVKTARFDLDLEFNSIEFDSMRFEAIR